MVNNIHWRKGHAFADENATTAFCGADINNLPTVKTGVCKRCQQGVAGQYVSPATRRIVDTAKGKK